MNKQAGAHSSRAELAVFFFPLHPPIRHAKTSRCALSATAPRRWARQNPHHHPPPPPAQRSGPVFKHDPRPRPPLLPRFPSVRNKPTPAADPVPNGYSSSDHHHAHANRHRHAAEARVPAGPDARGGGV
uniref:Uncharacterized protein n=1 Tax=Aegilops tauschii subsp. strangulata TaxID=200361 RepID=A0A453M4X5_AEGTS